MNRTELPSPALAARSCELFERDVRDFRVEVERLSEKRIKLWEPISFTAPSIARPYCCYLNTVIFYHHPHLLTVDGRDFQRWEERATLLQWDSDILFEGKIYRVLGGRVKRRKGGWWMEREARYREDAYLNRSNSDLSQPSSLKPEPKDL